MTKLSREAYAILEGRHSDPFHYLGPHDEGGQTVVRAFLPDAATVETIAEHGEVGALARIHQAGLFAGALPNGARRYQLRARFGDHVVDLEDPYRFPPVLSDYDLYLLGEGTQRRLYDKLGAHPLQLEAVDGVAFVVWAPNARRVSVVGDFNGWDARRHPMRRRGAGYWELFVPHAKSGDHYKFDMIGPEGEHLPLNPIRSPLPRRYGRKPPPSCSMRRISRPRGRRQQASMHAARRSRSTKSISARGGARATMSG